MKYVFDPILWNATGQICATTIEPIAPALAEKLTPLARTYVGKSCPLSQSESIPAICKSTHFCTINPRIWSKTN
jgi:hypothetical protein